MKNEGLSQEQACSRIFLVKTDGLVIKSRKTLSEQQMPFAKDGPDLKDLEEVVKVNGKNEFEMKEKWNLN